MSVKEVKEPHEDLDNKSGTVGNTLKHTPEASLQLYYLDMWVSVRFHSKKSTHI